MTRIVAALALAFAIQVASADVLLIEEVRESERRDLPTNGQSKTDIETDFGPPTQKHPAVGEPPISRWEYADFSVYFEYDLVLFSVLHRDVVIEK